MPTIEELREAVREAEEKFDRTDGERKRADVAWWLLAAKEKKYDRAYAEMKRAAAERKRADDEWDRVAAEYGRAYAEREQARRALKAAEGD